jgi:acetyl esterase/lipase
MQNRRLFLAGLSGAALAPFLPGAAFAKAVAGVSYGPNKLDIYPAAQPGAPVCVYVHGGGWRLGSREAVASMPEWFAAQGWGMVSVGYSLSANVGRQAAEVAQAVQWVGANIGGYNGDGARLALMGHSAGCHLSCLAALKHGAPVKALIANDTAAYDVAYLASLNHGVLPFIYAQPFSDRSRWQEWSPISYASARPELPVLVAWSGGANRDKVSARFIAALQGGGHAVTPFNGAAYSHISISRAIGKPGDPLANAVGAFLRQHV